MRQRLRNERRYTAPPAVPDWPRVSRVLLARLRSIGDTVLMTPCLQALKSWRPDIEITVLSEPLAAPVLEGHPLVDHLTVVDSSLGARPRLIARLRKERFDVGFNLHGGTTAMLLTALSGAKHTVAYGDYRLSWLLTARAPAPDVLLGRSILHSVEQQLALLHWAGVPMTGERPRLSLAVSAEAEAAVRHRLAERGVAAREEFALLSPAAAFASKTWTAAGFASVSDHLMKRWNLRSVVIAGPGQEAVAQEVAAAAASGLAVLTGISLKEVIALTQMAQIFVGNDSGPMHIAAALNRPVVAVFGSSNPDVWHPWTDAPYRVITARKRGSDLQATIRDIPAAEVIAAADETLELTAAHSIR